jgi:putative phosphoribosyl transferase
LIFRNRPDAGQALAKALAPYKGRSVAVYALPRGGVPVAAEIARALDAPLDLLLVRKIGVPLQPELAMGAVIDGGKPVVVRNPDVIAMTQTSEAEFQEICKAELQEIERRRNIYLKGRKPIDPKGRIAIIVDDGIATGATMRAALHAVRRRNPEKLILAVPVAPPDTLAKLRNEVDEIVCLHSPDPFLAIGLFYGDFSQVSDDEVTAILARAPAASSRGTA